MDASTIVYCKDRLEEQLQKAKESLKGVDNNLKKFISRNVPDAPLRTAFNKTPVQTNEKWKINKDESNLSSNFRRRPAKVLGDNDIENIPVKKRLGPKILHSSISGPPRKSDDYDDGLPKKPTVSSCVIAKPHILPSRKDAVSVKTYTETRARDRRMFGALLGTLQKFRQEETQLKDKEDKKAKVEKKLEDAARREKEKIRRERQKLMDFRKQRESYIKAVENNMKLVKEQEQWEELQRPLFNYIRTEAKPVICYLPKVHNEKTTELLQQCKQKLTKLIEEKRQSVKEEVDTLIAQWQNVNIEELLGSEVEKLPGRDADHAPDRSNQEETTWDDHPNTISSVQKQNSVVINGSWSTSDPAQTWRTEETTELYSAKEQRIKRKLTDAVSIKEEKEDDYEFQLPVKQEKNTPQPADDESETARESPEVNDQPETEVADRDDTEPADNSPKEKEDEHVSDS